MNLVDIVGREWDRRDAGAPQLDRVCELELAEDCTTLGVNEECDQFFGIDLTPVEVDRLVTWLQAQRARMPR